ncbi:MAG TPA: HAMP domain-containing protein, partial [Polyangiaceae bacterium]
MPPPPKPSGITILHKIMGLIVGLVVVLVGTLAIYFPTRQVADYRETLANKAATYGEVLANELRPAVAFDDRETAREIFEGVAEDRDVVAIALYKQDGTSLETRGMLAPATVAALGSTPAPFADTIGERVVAIESVTSLEGPKGKLVLELSTASLQQLRHRALWIGLIVGICGIAMGAVAAWLIGRSLANRLRALAEVATAVAAGHLDTRPVIDGGNDEIGVMAHAFHKMLVQLRTLIAEMQKSARDEQTRLEKEVAQRTQALDRRNDDMRLLLDNAAQGFLTLDRNAVISGERSASVDLWLSPAPGASFGECVEKLVPDFGAMFAADWSQAISDDLPLELTITQLPRSLAIETRHFSIEYRPILDEGGKLDKMMLVISDISEHFERQRAEQDER